MKIQNQSKKCKNYLPDFNDMISGHRSRLRNKFLISGENFADYELLELLLTFSIPRKDVKPIAKILLNKFGSISKIIHAEYDDLLSVVGIKQNSIVLLKLIQELELRELRTSVKEAPLLNNYSKLLDYCWLNVAHKNVEQFRILYLDNNFYLIDDCILQEGTINYAMVYPRELIKKVLFHAAVSIIIVHNHPSGNVEYSKEDLDITLKIRDSLNSIDVKLLDHIIIGTNKSYFSFKNAGFI